MLVSDHFLFILFFLAGMLSLAMALLALGKQPRKFAWPFALMAFLTALWAFAYVLELTAPDIASKLFYVKIEYLAVATIPTLWFIFILEYTGRTGLTKRKFLALLFLEPLITILLAWTNEFHHLIYTQTQLARLGEFLLLAPSYGIWFWLHAVYSYTLVVAVGALIWDHYRRSDSGGGKEALILALASIAPWVGNFFVARVWTGPHIDLVPIFLTLGYVIALVWLWKMGKTDVVPIARKTAIEEMSDAYLVLDKELYILDMNKAAEASFGRPKSKLIGSLLEDVAPPDVPLENLLAPSLPFRQVVEQAGVFYEINVESIPNSQGERIGILVTWRDITSYIIQKRLLEERVSQLNSVNYIIETINRAATLREIYDAALRSIRETLHADQSSILLFDQNGVMKFVAWSGLSENYRQKAEGHSLWTPYSVNPQPVFVEDIEQADESQLCQLQDVIREENIKALGFVPIVHQGRVLGKLAVYYSAPHHFVAREIELIEIIAGHLAIAIEKVRLLEQARNRLSRIEALQKIDAAISATLDLEHQIDILLTHVLNELQCDVSVLFLVDRASGQIIPAAAKGSYNFQMQQGTSFEVGEGGVGWIVLHKRNLYIPNVQEDERWKATESSEVEHIVSYLGIPLMVNGEVIGALDVGTRRPREFTPEEIEFLQTLGGQAAVAIKNAQLYQDLQKKVSQLEVLNDISRKLMAEHDIDFLLQKVVSDATGLLSASHGMILLYEEEKKLLTVAADSANLGHPLMLGEGLAGRVAQTRRTMILDNYSQWEHRASNYEDVPIAAAIGTPMMHGGQLIGVLLVYEIGESDRKFTEEDIRPLSLLASQAASAVFNAQLIKRLHQRINRLQTLHQISAELSKLKGAEASCHAVAWLVHEKMGYASVCIVLIDPVTQERWIVACLGNNCQRVGKQIPKGRGLIEWTIRERRLHYWPDISKQPDYYPEGGEAQCEVDVPIQSRERLFGVMVVEEEEVDAFDQEDFDTLRTVANQLAIALENAQRVEELSSLLHTTTKLYQASQAVGGAERVFETVKTSVQSLRNSSEANGVFIHIFEEAHRMTYGVDSYGNELIDQEGGRLMQEMSDMLSDVRAITTIEPERLPQALQWRNVGMGVAFPLKRGAEILGDILMLYEEAAPASPQQMDLLAIYANQTTTAIEKAISMEQANRRALEQEVVSSIARSLNETLDVQKAFPSLAADIKKLVSADRVSIALADEERTEFVVSVIAGIAEGVIDNQWMPLEFSSAAEHIRGGEVHFSVDFANERSFQVENMLYEAGYRSRVCLPLKVRDEILGSLNLVSRRVNAFTPDHLPPLSQIADALAISIMNSRSIAEERKRAQEITLLYSLSRRLSSLNAVEDVVGATVETLMGTIKGLKHARVILTSVQFRNYVIPRTLIGPYHLWVNHVSAYPIIARAIQREIGCFKVHRDDPALEPAEKKMIFSLSGEYAWLLPLAQEDEALGVLVMEWDKQGCSDSELRLVKSVAELLMMTLRRVFLFHEVAGAYLNAVLALALASDAKDSYTADHSQRLEDMAVAVAEKMGLGQQQIEDLRFGARLHDIGKIGVPDAILKKPGPLTEEEWETMHKHPEIGENILAPLPRLRGAARIVRHHHERYDGKGYPDHLAGDDIPLGARILAVVDAYGAMTDRRVYKAGRSHHEAISELKSHAGTQFDPEVVDVFLELFGDSPPVTNHDNHE